MTTLTQPVETSEPTPGGLVIAAAELYAACDVAERFIAGLFVPYDDVDPKARHDVTAATGAAALDALRAAKLKARGGRVAIPPSGEQMAAAAAEIDAT